MPVEVLDFKKYLTPSVISKLNSFDLKARLMVEGFMTGLHKSPYHGFSVEFSEHRQYMQGDNLKDVDWKVYGKTERFYVKQYEEETNLKCSILLDVSKSMSYASEGNISKIEYGAALAGGLSYLMVNQQDACGLTLYSDSIENYMQPKSSRIYLQQILKTLSAIQPSNKTNTANCLNSIVEKIKQRGMVIIISDFFDDLNSVITSIKNFRYANNDVIIFQILDPLEMNFDFGSDAVFKDIETGEELTTQPHQIQKAYLTSMKSFTDRIKSECLNSNIEYNLINTKTQFDKALFSYITKRNKIK